VFIVQANNMLFKKFKSEKRQKSFKSYFNLNCNQKLVFQINTNQLK